MSFCVCIKIKTTVKEGIPIIKHKYPTTHCKVCCRVRFSLFLQKKCFCKEKTRSTISWRDVVDTAPYTFRMTFYSAIFILSCLQQLTYHILCHGKACNVWCKGTAARGIAPVCTVHSLALGRTGVKKCCVAGYAAFFKLLPHHFA